MLRGLQCTASCYSILTDLWILLDPSDNYKHYRERWTEAAGLPFLMRYLAVGFSVH